MKNHSYDRVFMLIVRLSQAFLVFSIGWFVYWAHIYEITVWQKPFIQTLSLSSLNVILYMISIIALVGIEVGIRRFKHGNRTSYRVIKRVNNRVRHPQPQIAKKRTTFLKCKRCGQVFKEPEVKLSLKNGKLQSVQVCPYCQAVLGKNEERNPNAGIKIGFDDRKEIETEHK